ncbi:hypothetical protein BAE44_0009304 [Dichanthelium oligosanthes]|uniref:Uncharacterized protein n=1 Tax=Dichanthelium oligosanthes TaxID=888268 RepID=A0A1E5VX33_9POAL|nr:hypothetical protein BAE44_0009304 [Dichanthelium oligosanthes]
MRPARRGGGGAVGGASARAALLLLLLLVVFLVLLIGSRGAEATRAVPRRSAATGGKARSRSHGSHGGARVAAMLPRKKAMPLPGTRPVPVRLAPAPAGSAEEESKRRIPSCPDPLHNR